MPDSSDVTELLNAHREGDDGALDRLMPLLYEDLARIAHAHLRGNSRELHDTSSLIHEAYLWLVDQSRASWNDRNHFLRLCARAMRQILVSTARKKKAAKRGGNAKAVV